MPSPFAKLMSVAAATCDGILGDTFEYRPMKAAPDPKAPRVVDPDRPITQFIAPFGEAAARAMSGPFNQPSVRAEHPGHASTRPFISLDLSRLTFRPKAGDQVWSEEKSTLYRIAEVVPSQVGFVRLDLNIEKGKG